MRLLDRYLLRELLVPLGFCLSGFLIFWASFDLLSEIDGLQKRNLRAGDVLQYYLIRTPEFLVMVVPIALLLALLYALSHHARQNELTAMRAAGISLWRLSAPYFGVGLIASMIVFALNELWVPDSAVAAERILQRRAAEKAEPGSRWHVKLGFENSRDGRRWLLDYNPETREMRNIHLDWRNLDDGSRRVIVAERAVRSKGLWVFYNVQEHTEAPGHPLPFNRNQAEVLPMPELSETPHQINSEIRISRRLAVGRAKKPDIPLRDIADYLRLHPNPSGADRAWLYTNLHSRLALPWTCVVVVLIALPFGALPGRRNVFVGVAGSILICFAYFVLMQVSLPLGTSGALPPWFAAWFPNLTFGAAGALLTIRMR